MLTSKGNDIHRVRRRGFSEARESHTGRSYCVKKDVRYVFVKKKKTYNSFRRLSQHTYICISYDGFRISILLTTYQRLWIISQWGSKTSTFILFISEMYSWFFLTVISSTGFEKTPPIVKYFYIFILLSTLINDV